MRINKNCIGCGQCVTFCPNQAISVYGRAIIDENCIQCGICISYCPIDAIRRDEE